MPDNVELGTASGGATIATDLNTATTAHHQRVKLDYGALDTFNIVSSANPLPVATASSGLTQISGTVTVVNTSSGLVQISGTPTVVSASSGLVQISGTPVVAISSSALAPVNIVTSGGAYVPVTTGSGVLVLATGPMGISGTVTVLSASSGLVQISGTPTIVSASSGLIQISGVPIVTATAATNPWSSAPGFNVPVVSVSSGLIQISGTPIVTATAATNPWSSAPGFNVPVVTVSSGLTQISGTVTILSASSGLVQISGTPTVVQGAAGTADWRTDARRGLTLNFASISATSSGSKEIVASTPTLKIKVLSYAFLTSGAVNVTWESSGTALTGVMSFGANGGISAPPVAPASGHWLETSVAGNLRLNLSAGVTVGGHLSYIYEA